MEGKSYYEIEKEFIQVRYVLEVGGVNVTFEKNISK